MGLEQRGRVRQLHHRNNWRQDELDACDKQTIRDYDWGVCLMGAE